VTLGLKPVDSTSPLHNSELIPRRAPRFHRLIQRMSFSVVPVLKARVMALKFVQKNPKVQEILNHPAGPFTSAYRCNAVRVVD
jgi:hypothetical protein